MVEPITTHLPGHGSQDCSLCGLGSEMFNDDYCRSENESTGNRMAKGNRCSCPDCRAIVAHCITLAKQKKVDELPGASDESLRTRIAELEAERDAQNKNLKKWAKNLLVCANGDDDADGTLLMKVIDQMQRHIKGDQDV